MRTVTADMWHQPGDRVVVITTNGKLCHDGSAFMGNSCATEAAQRVPDLAKRLGKLLLKNDNQVFDLGSGIVSFPVESSPLEMSSINVLLRAALDLRELADRNGWKEVVFPPPACGGEGFCFPEVRKLLEEVLDDRFLLIVRE